MSGIIGGAGSRSGVIGPKTSVDTIIISGQVGSSAPLAGPLVIPFDDFWVNQGGIVYNTTTKRFTVPVAGKYRITMNPFLNGPTCRIFIGVNTDTPSATTHRGHCYWTSGGLAANYCSPCIDSVVSLAASDYIVYNLYSGSLYNTPGDRFSQFSIQLIS